MPSGELRGSILGGSIYWVLLVWGCFSVSKTIIPDAQEHFLTHSTRRDTYLVGGLGLREYRVTVTMSDDEVVTSNPLSIE